MGQGIHTGGSGQALRHAGHHIRVDDCDNRNIVSVYTYKFTFFLNIGDNVVDGNLCCGTCGGRNCDDRYARFLGRSYALKASYILKLRVVDDDADGFCGIHGRTAADGDEIVSAGCLKCCNAGLYILDGRVWFDIGVNLISKTSLIQDIGHLLGYAKFDQIRVGTYESFCEASDFYFICNLFDSACAMIRSFI